MSPEQHMILDVTFATIGVLLGWLLCREHYRAKAWEYWECLVDCEEELEEAEDLLEDFRLASRPIVHELESVGDQTDWKDGPETDRVYPWYEIEPLAKCLEKQRDREQRIIEGREHDEG